MELRAAELVNSLNDKFKARQTIELRETGTVLSASDGIARIYGLDRVAAESCYNSRTISMGCAQSRGGTMLAPPCSGSAGDQEKANEVRRTGRIAEVRRSDHVGAWSMPWVSRWTAGTSRYEMKTRRIEVKAPGSSCVSR